MARLTIFQALRAFFVVLVFSTGCFAIVTTQVLTKYCLKNRSEVQQSFMNYTKRNFVTLLVFIIQIIVPTKITVTHDASLPKGSFKSMNSILKGILADHAVIVANHQLYTDWLFLWFFFYAADLGDSIFIMLKDLSKLPILGYGMNNFNFLFMSRKWEIDKITITNQLGIIDANARGMGPSNGVQCVSSVSSNSFTNSDDPNSDIANSSTPNSNSITKWPSGYNMDKKCYKWPFQFILFPEGTVWCPDKRALSEKFCRNKDLPILNHVLLPRSRGLFFSLRKLRKSCEMFYDITIGYSDLSADEYGEVRYTLGQFFLHGNGPESVNFYVRGYKIEDIPLGGDSVDTDSEEFERQLEIFEQWLFKIWYEKDELLDTFFKTGKFLSIDESEELEKNQEALEILSNTVEADIKLNHWYDILDIYVVAFIAVIVLRSCGSLFRRIFT